MISGEDAPMPGTSGTNPLSSVQSRYITLVQRPVCSSKYPHLPPTTLLSAYAGYVGSQIAIRFLSENRSVMPARSLFAPSPTKISSGRIFTPYCWKSTLAMASRRKAYPSYGPYPRNVAASPISAAASSSAFITTGHSGFVTSPIPRLITSASGWLL